MAGRPISWLQPAVPLLGVQVETVHHRGFALAIFTPPKALNSADPAGRYPIISETKQVTLKPRVGGKKHLPILYPALVVVPLVSVNRQLKGGQILFARYCRSFVAVLLIAKSVAGARASWSEPARVGHHACRKAVHHTTLSIARVHTPYTAWFLLRMV